MSRVHGLTDLKVKLLKPRDEPYFTWDPLTTGLGIKVTPEGRKIWVVQLKWPGGNVQTKRTLGRYPGVGLADARRIAGEWYALAKAGRDPAEVQAEQQAKQEAERHAAKLKAEREDGNTFRSVAEAFIEGRTNKRAEADAREIRRSLIAVWGDKPVHSITAADARTYFAELIKRAPYEAKNAWGHADQIFKWAVFNEKLASSPIASLPKNMVFANAKIGPRKRVLNDDEIKALWCAAVDRGGPEGQAVRFLMLTGCRLGEALGARWKEFHPELRRALRDKGSVRLLGDDAKLWTIPPERFKSDETHIVPLTADMVTVLALVPVRSPDDLVFSHMGDHQLGSLSKLKRDLDERMTTTLQELAAKRRDDAAELPRWVLHDLRRVVRTNLSALGVPDNVAEAVIGHGKKGLQRIYDQHRYLPEIRSALTKWNARLATIVKGRA